MMAMMMMDDGDGDADDGDGDEMMMMAMAMMAMAMMMMMMMRAMRGEAMMREALVTRVTEENDGEPTPPFFYPRVPTQLIQLYQCYIRVGPVVSYSPVLTSLY